MSNYGTITITARTLDLAREALADWTAEHPYRVLDRVAVTRGGEGSQRIRQAGAWGLPLGGEGESDSQDHGSHLTGLRGCGMFCGI